MGHTRAILAAASRTSPDFVVVPQISKESTVTQVLTIIKWVLIWWAAWSAIIFIVFMMTQTKPERQKNGPKKLAYAAMFLGAIWPYYFSVYVWGMTIGEIQTKRWNRTHY